MDDGKARDDDRSCAFSFISVHEPACSGKSRAALASIVATYCGRFRMHVVNLLPIQEKIVENCPEEETARYLYAGS